MVPCRCLQSWSDVRCSRNGRCWFCSHVAFFCGCSNAELNRVGSVFNTGNHVELFRHREVLTKPNHIFELVEIVARCCDGPLLSVVAAGKRQNFAVTSTPASHVGQYTRPCG